MTPAIIRDLPGGRKEGVCVLCGQHTKDGRTRPHVVPLDTPDDIAQFEGAHALGRAGQP
jgi:hypothetical protein